MIVLGDCDWTVHDKVLAFPTPLPEMNQSVAQVLHSFMWLKCVNCEFLIYRIVQITKIMGYVDLSTN